MPLTSKAYEDSNPGHNVTRLAVERSNHYTIETRYSKRWYTLCEEWFKERC